MKVYIVRHGEVPHNVLKMYNLGFYEKEIVKSLSENDNKIKYLLEKNFNQNDSVEILETLDEKTLISFFKQNKDFYKKNNIHPYDVIWRLNKEKQKNFISSLEDMDFTLNEKLEILAVLKPEVKQEIDTSNLPEKYKDGEIIFKLKGCNNCSWKFR